jgi:hypothetical protein
MSRINTGKVLVGGLVAGVVMNIIDMATNMFILMNDMKAELERLHLDVTIMDSAAGIVPWIVVDFLSGILLVFAYAAMRPRFGPGPKTAMIAGLTLYLGITIVLYGFTAMGLFTMSTFLKGSVCALVSTLAGALAGAAVYKEPAPAIDRPAATRAETYTHV